MSTPSELHFTVDARIVEQLGQQLVPSDLMALAEIVKNAYDADASNVVIDYIDDGDEPMLIIEDDGSGMTFEALRMGWMHIGTANKVSHPRSPRFGRPRAGMKGVGRFAAQRLGSVLKLLTRTSPPHGEQITIEFDWTRYRAGLSLDEVRQTVRRESHAGGMTGTRMEIRSLARRWSRDSLLEVLQELVRLYTPPDAGARGAPYEADPGFAVIAAIHEDGNVVVFEDTDLLREERVMHLHGSVDGNGKGSFRLDFYRPEAPSKTVNYGSGDSSSAIRLRTGPLELDLDLFIFDRSWMERLGIRKAQAIGREHGGVRIRRDGFTVQPYGIGDDDWVGNESHVAARWMPLNMWRSQQILGDVRISRENNPAFEDMITRRGLIETAALADLRLFVYEGLKKAATEHEALKIRHNRKRIDRKAPSSPTEALAQEIERMRGEAASVVRTDSGVDNSGGRAQGPTGAPESPGVESALAPTLSSEGVSRLLEAVAAAEREQEEVHLRERDMLRVLASLGTGLAVFSHEFKGISRDLSSSSHELRALAPRLQGAEGRVAANIGSAIETGIGTLLTYSRYIDDFVSERSRRRRASIELWEFSQHFARVFHSLLTSKAVTLEVRVPRGLITVPMHRAELLSILFNLTTNAIKAMLAPGVTVRHLLIHGEFASGQVGLIVADSGCGVPNSLRDEVFEPFITHSHDPRDEELGQGTGLGLYIVRDIVTDYHGSVELIEAPTGYRTAVRVLLPAKETP